MVKRREVEQLLVVVSKRRTPTDEGLARLVVAMVMHQLEQRQESTPRREDRA